MSNYYFVPDVSMAGINKTLRDITQGELYFRPIVFLCIGTDRCTGDSLGPIIGYKLNKKIDKELLRERDIHIYGTLKSPVHALNLNLIIDEIAIKYANAYIIAIDASLGRSDRIGQVSIGKGPLTPGLGVGKTLPSVGDLHITGIVNSQHISSTHLTTTRLCHIMEMADYIVEAIISMLFCSVEID